MSELDETEKILFDEIRQINYASDLYELEEYASKFKVGHINVVDGEGEVKTASVMDALEYFETMVCQH